jgi:hypothetical protein
MVIYDTIGAGATNAFVFSNSGSGTIQGVRLVGVTCRDIHRRFISFISGVMSDFTVQNCASFRGGLEVSNTYDGMDFNAIAHNYVNITGNHLGGQQRYGLSNAVNITNCIISSNNLVDAQSGSTFNMGAASASRVIANNI